MLRNTLSALSMILTLVACSSNGMRSADISIDDHYFQGKAQLSQTSGGFCIALVSRRGIQLDRAIFNYQYYHLDTADVDHDGRTDILVGLIKETQFDPAKKKRLFILKIDEGQLRPLWLGSRVCQQLLEFKASTQGHVKTLEKTNTGYYVVGIYEWQGFGLTLLRYINKEKSYDEAHAIFNS